MCIEDNCLDVEMFSVVKIGAFKFIQCFDTVSWAVLEWYENAYAISLPPTGYLLSKI